MDDLQPRPGDLLYRILLAAPQTTTIPVFAMGVEAGRPAYDVQVVAKPGVTINGNLLRSLPDRFGPHGFLDIRHRRADRTATYSSWLGFAAQGDAEGFMGLVKHGKHGLDAMLAETERHREKAKRTFDANLGGGLFDLGRLEESQRRKQADLYVRLDDEIRTLGRHITGLRLFRESPFGEHPGESVG